MRDGALPDPVTVSVTFTAPVAASSGVSVMVRVAPLPPSMMPSAGTTVVPSAAAVTVSSRRGGFAIGDGELDRTHHRVLVAEPVRDSPRSSARS